MITGAHCLIFSTNPEADRAFLRDVLKLPYVDTGEDWLIFSLPPAEVAIHPAEVNDLHELYLMCDDIEAFIREMEEQIVPHDEITTANWGLLTRITLPGGGKLGVYQPLHARPGRP